MIVQAQILTLVHWKKTKVRETRQRNRFSRKRHSPRFLSRVFVNWLSAGGTLRRWFRTRRCLCILTYLGHFTNLCKSLLGGRAPPIPNCLGRFSNKGLATFATFSGACISVSQSVSQSFTAMKHRERNNHESKHPLLSQTASYKPCYHPLEPQNHTYTPFSSPQLVEWRTWECPSWEPAIREEREQQITSFLRIYNHRLHQCKSRTWRASKNIKEEDVVCQSHKKKPYHDDKLTSRDTRARARERARGKDCARELLSWPPSSFLLPWSVVLPLPSLT